MTIEDNELPENNDALVEVDVLDPVENEEETPLSREDKLAAISDSYNGADTGTIVDSLGNEITEYMSAEDYDDADPELAMPAPESPIFLNDNNEYAMTLNVNGQEITRTVKEMQADSQKHLSADRRLQDIAAQQKEFDVRLAELAHREEALNQSVAQNPQPSSQDVGEAALDGARNVVDEIFDGNTDSAAERLAQLIDGRQEPTQIDPDAIGRQATADAISQIESMNADKAYTESVGRGAEWVNEHHPEITASESLTRFVDTEINVIMANEPNTSPEQAIKLATESVLEQMGKPVEAEVSSRTQNKAGLQREPARRAARKPRPEPVVIDNSPSAVIAEMRKQRQVLTGRAVK